MLENIYSRWELLTNGIGYQNQSEQHKARRASSEDSCKPNSKTKIGRKQGREQFWYQRKQKEQWQVESHNDPTEMNTSMMMALPQWSLGVSDTFLHEGLDSSRHVSWIYLPPKWRCSGAGALHTRHRSTSGAGALFFFIWNCRQILNVKTTD
jgi:hypothetical protein